jgi:outer membrane lipoprotein-sorting protein
MSVAASVHLSRRRLLLTAVVIAAVSLAGCTAFTGESNSFPNGTTAGEQYRSLEGYSATATIEQSDSPGARLRLWVDPDDARSRTELVAPPSRTGNIAVANATTVVQYNATENEFVRISASGRERFERGVQQIADAVDAARADGETTTDAPPVGGAPLPVVPAGEEQSPDDSRFTVTYEGTEQLLGRTAHVINYTATGDRSRGVLRQTVWLDTEYFVTLKSIQVSRFDGNRSTYRFELTNATFGIDFPAERFRFDPPEGATLDANDSYDLRSYESLRELANATTLTVPEPDVPDRYRLTTADRIDGRTFDAVQLRYRAGASSLVVTKTTEQSYIDTENGDPVAVAGQDARYRSTGVQSLLVWQCGDVVYTVVGDLQRATVVEVAQSVACT